MTAPVRALLFPVGRAAVTVQLPRDPDQAWRMFRELVGGWVEHVPLTSPDRDGWVLSAHVNEDGILVGLPFNRAFLYPRGAVRFFGPVVLVRERIDGEGGSEYADVTAEDEALVCAAELAVEAAVQS